VAAGDFAAWTATIGVGGRTISQAGGLLEWETEVQRDGIFSLVGADTAAKVSEAGRYFVRYDFSVEDDPLDATPKTRAAVLAHLRVNGVEQPWGRALAYWSNAQSCRDGHASAAAVLELAADDEVSVHAVRVDTETAGAGRTVRLSSPGQFSLWRVPDGWRLLRAKLSADGPVSDLYGSSPLFFDALELSDPGWARDALGFSFDPSAAGAAYSALSHVFLVSFALEAISSDTTQGELEAALLYSGGFAPSVDYGKQAFATSFAEGPGNCRRAVVGWSGLVEGIAGEAGVRLEDLAVSYLHRNTTTATFTPKAEKAALQVLAIPRAEFEYVHARKATGGQAAGEDGVVSLDSTVHEDPSFDHVPAGDDSEVRALSPGCWALGFASAFVRPSPL
jgi:hypothetical protein